jgi:aryl-alcohol dehydrogenase-like predicted oxidoreductase
MRQVMLAAAGIRTSSLGFGCASILGAVGAERAWRALEMAFDAGIRHFDLARSYGFGEAEQFFGQFARGKRSAITITTKFGIVPSAYAAAFGYLKPAARALFDLAPGLRPRLLSRIVTLSQRRIFDATAARRSLDASLQALRTDYVDCLLMHDCRWGEFDPETMDELAMELKRAGKIRAFGLATSWDETAAILASGAPSVDVVQVADNFLQWPNRHCLPSVTAMIRHSPFRFNLEDGDPTRIATIRSLLSEAGYDAVDLSTWRDLSLGLVLRALPQGPVICSMFDPRHIARNIEVADGGRFPEALLSAILAAAT